MNPERESALPTQDIAAQLAQLPGCWWVGMRAGYLSPSSGRTVWARLTESCPEPMNNGCPHHHDLDDPGTIGGLAAWGRFLTGDCTAHARPDVAGGWHIYTYKNGDVSATPATPKEASEGEAWARFILDNSARHILGVPHG